jgi:hypothetical protein
MSSIRSNGFAPQNGASADAEETVHGPYVITLADQALHEFEAVDVGQREVRLDALVNQALDVLEIAYETPRPGTLRWS